MQNLKFSNAGPSESKIISQLADRIWRKYYPAIITLEQIDYMLVKMYSEESIQQQMKEGQKFTILYEDENPIGYCAVSTKDNANYFLHKLYVDVEQHSKGVGRILFDHILTSATNLKSMELTVNRKNFKAINFYFKMGFKIDRVADFDIGNGYFMNDFVMVRKCCFVDS